MTRSPASLLLVAILALGCSDREDPGTGGEDGGPGDFDGDVAPDGGHSGDGGGAGDGGGSGDDAGPEDAGPEDSGPDDAGGEPDRCIPPPCPAPPEGCHYEGFDPCSCGTLVCDALDAGPPALGCEETGVPCGPRQYCDYPAGSMCGRADGRPGVCAISPDACIDLFDPVCGCDGMTYSNSCYAHAAGTDDATSGDCS